VFSFTKFCSTNDIKYKTRVPSLLVRFFTTSSTCLILAITIDRTFNKCVSFKKKKLLSNFFLSPPYVLYLTLPKLVLLLFSATSGERKIATTPQFNLCVWFGHLIVLMVNNCLATYILSLCLTLSVSFSSALSIYLLLSLPNLFKPNLTLYNLTSPHLHFLFLGISI
jgi:hypothetical protein